MWYAMLLPYRNSALLCLCPIFSYDLPSHSLDSNVIIYYPVTCAKIRPGSSNTWKHLNLDQGVTDLQFHPYLILDMFVY